jgi:hypothetical protein
MKGELTEYIEVEMKQEECICPLSWNVHFNFLRDGNYSEGDGRSPPTLISLGYLSIMMECTYVRKRPLPVYLSLCVYSEGEIMKMGE